ncbi:hypothetical protein SLH49_06730 [Cognatiyoonia sp. IB215446]|uniref:hypothetical protein n=1 Tax=Cognatiyoonia sp. IB215446 TaxID=3097355 RepID=UPI002A0C9BFD|nr:hypothetical protein [Cognatiyoonia sp. IB215446]MDX8347677.1 hypothetical protein [Cognatiyoonia sp. IB215446]
MASALPPYYFRIRENGAAVFRINTENRQGRIDMEQIAVVNTNRGDFKPHGDQELNQADEAAINDWITARQAQLAARDLDEMRRTRDQLNLMTQWALSKATDAQLEELTDDILLAIHDLRAVLVRKKADRLAKP